MKEPEYGWFGAGWASFRTGNVAEYHLPPDSYNALAEWLNGFLSAHMQYPDIEAMEGILEGDFSRGEKAEDALLRIAPVVYIYVSESETLKKEFDLDIP